MGVATEGGAHEKVDCAPVRDALSECTHTGGLVVVDVEAHAEDMTSAVPCRPLPCVSAMWLSAEPGAQTVHPGDSGRP